MADELSMALQELLRKADAADRADFVRTAVERLAHQVIEAKFHQGYRRRRPLLPTRFRNAPVSTCASSTHRGKLDRINRSPLYTRTCTHALVP